MCVCSGRYMIMEVGRGHHVPRETELQLVESHQLRACNQTPVLQYSRQCS